MVCNECTFSKLADDAKVRGAVRSLEGQESSQWHLDKLVLLAVVNGIKFDKSKCQFLHLGWSNVGHRRGFSGKQSCRKGPVSAGQQQLNMSQQRVPWQSRGDWSCILGCIRKGIPSQSKKWLSHFIQCWCDLTLSTVWTSGPQHLRRIWRFHNVPRVRQPSCW